MKEVNYEEIVGSPVKLSHFYQRRKLYTVKPLDFSENNYIQCAEGLYS